MEDEYGADLNEIFRVVDTADVLVVRFPIVQERLLIDARHTDTDGPLIQLVPPAGSAEQRFRHLKALRPRLSLPEGILTFMWQRHVDSLQPSGVWRRIVDRLAATGWPGVEERCAAVWDELVEAERRQVVAAIRGGEGYQSLWERAG